MNEFISPQQNININISYNLGASSEKVPKVIFGRKIPKIIKAKLKEPDSEVKNYRKSEAIIPPKHEDKKYPHSKNQKSKKMTLHQNLFTQSQEFAPPRRLKTEGNLIHEAVSTTIHKKQPKSHSKAHHHANNSKSFFNPNKSCSKQQAVLTKSVPVKKPIKNKKASENHQQQSRNRNNSCFIYPSKKHVVSEVDHVVSLLTEPAKVSKKRASSASVIRGDKFVGKLMDMSVLISEIGGSFPVKDEQDKGDPSSKHRSNVLHDFMNSIDMRVVKSMKADQLCQKKTLLKDLFMGEGVQLITYLNKIKRIPMQRLHEKARTIQRFWKQKTSESVLPYYENLFKNAAMGIKTMQTEEISQIQLNVEDLDDNDEENILFSSKEKQKNGCEGIDLLKKYRLQEEDELREDEQEDENEGESESSQGQEQAEEEESGESGEKEGQAAFLDQPVNFNDDPISSSSHSSSSELNQRSLNIKKYQQLVKKTIAANNNSSNNNNNHKKEKQSKEQGDEERSSHWNHVHNILSTNISQKAPIISNVVLEELMRQSAYNKQWIEGDFSSDSRKMSLKESPRGASFEIPGKVINHGIEEKVPSNNNDNFKEEQDRKHFTTSNIKQEAVILDDEDEQEYNWSKYSDISNIKKPQMIIDIECRNNGKKNSSLPAGLTKQSKSLNAHRQHSKSNSSESNYEEDENQEWIRSENTVVNSYLDCGLDHFGLKYQGEKSVEAHKRQEEVEVEEAEAEEEDGMKKSKTLDVIEEQEEERIRYIKPKRKASDSQVLFSNGQEQEDQEEQSGEQKVYVFENEHLNNNAQREDARNYLEIRLEQERLKRQKIHQQSLIKESQSEWKEGEKQKDNMKEFQPFQIPNHSENNEVNFQEILNPQNSQQSDEQITRELQSRRVDKITEDLVIILLEEFAMDVSSILRRTQNNQNQKQQGTGEKNNARALYQDDNVVRQKPQNKNPHGIITTFQTIRDFITKLKKFILENQDYSQKVIDNLKNNIGPTSFQILSYLRVEPEDEEEDGAGDKEEEEENGEEQAEEWLFVVPNELFEKFNKDLIAEEEQKSQKKLSNRMKLYTQFWHRSIFECYNQCLDYQRPYGITGAPYVWIVEPKLSKKVSIKKVSQILDSAENRLLELSCSSSGIIFDKPESPYRQFHLNEDACNQLNEERISRMLANQILDDQYNWITYNDEMTELLVDVSRKIEDILIFQMATDLKKMFRKRKGFSVQEEDFEEDQEVVFEISQL